MATNRTANRTNQTFSKALFNALVGALSAASGSHWMIASESDADSNPDRSGWVRIKLALAGSLRGEVQLECDHVAAEMLASKLLRRQSDEFGTEQSEALLKMVEAGVCEFRTVLAPEYGDFAISAGSSSEPPSDLAYCDQITIADDNASRASISMYLSPLLTETLSLRTEDPDKATGDKGPMQGGSGEVTPEQVNLDLVMDVELSVTLRFGQRQLTLREVLELTTGSVIELDRQVEEPVELLLEGKVIARGEAVVIDGNYGLRVTEVSQTNFCPTIR